MCENNLFKFLCLKWKLHLWNVAFETFWHHCLLMSIEFASLKTDQCQHDALIRRALELIWPIVAYIQWTKCITVIKTSDLQHFLTKYSDLYFGQFLFYEKWQSAIVQEIAWCLATKVKSSATHVEACLRDEQHNIYLPVWFVFAHLMQCHAQWKLPVHKIANKFILFI